jgi:hypothetical protein
MQLTQRTTAGTLKGLSDAAFGQFRANPKTFIAERIRLINAHKAKLIVAHLADNSVEDKFRSEHHRGRAEQSKAKQSRAKQSRAKQSRAEQSRAEQSRAEQSKAKQSKAKQSKAKQSKAKQSKAKQSNHDLDEDRPSLPAQKQHTARR